MEPGGFLDTRRSSPVGLGLIIAAHAAVLTAIALAPPETFTRITFLPTKLIDIPKDRVPPEVPPPVAQPTERRAQQVTKTTAIVPTRSTGDGIITDVDPGPTAADKGAAEPVKLVPIEPVFVQAAIDPRAAGRFQPDYPLSLIRAGTEGTATVRVLIGSDGTVKQVEMVSATDPAFFEATRKQALRYWRFRAATRDGVATESWRTMTVRFRIDG